MEVLIPTLLVLGLMAAVVLLFRAFVRRPAAGMSEVDPPGVRTVVTFSGNDSEFFEQDRPDEPFVGIRLFELLCDGLAADSVEIDHRGRIQNAQRAECVVGADRFGLVLEWIDGSWALGVDWVPESTAEKRHLALTHQVFAPPDTPSLRRLLSAIDRWIKNQPKLSNVRWYRKEKWIAEDPSDPRDVPLG
jgi:hypothetical protein